MPWVTSEPEMMSTASGNLAGVGSSMAAQNAVAAVPTTGAVPPAADLVSNVIAAQFVLQAQQYQQLAATAQAIHNLIVENLSGSASAYTMAEHANTLAAG
jgi:hypothetical protein